MSNELRAAVSAGFLSPPQQEQMLAAIEDHENLDTIRTQLAAFDWKSLLPVLLPFVTQFIPGLGPIISAILALLKIIPTPNNGGSDIPTPH